MKLDRFGKIRRHRIFLNFSWNSSLDNFGRFNIIYGWNGTGKTTLAGLFKAVQHRRNLSEGEVDFVFDGQNIRGAELATAATPQVRVFDKDTVARSVFELSSDQTSSRLPPVYVFGEESAEKQRELDSIKRVLVPLVEQRAALIARENRTKKEIDEFSVKTARAIKNLLVAPEGEFNNYNAANFKVDIGKFSKDPLPLLAETERETLLTLKDGRPMEAVTLPHLYLPNIAAVHSEVSEVLKKTVASTLIQELISDPALSRWVETGLALHSHKPGPDCKFCEQPLPVNRIQNLERHFNDEFRKFVETLDVLSNRLENIANEVDSSRFPESIHLYPELRRDYEAALLDCKLHRTSLKDGILALSTAVKRKKERIFEQLDLSNLLSGGDGAINNLPSGWRRLWEAFSGGAALLSEFMSRASFERANAVVDIHNAKTASFGQQVKSARARLHQHELAIALEEWREKEASAAEVEIDTNHVRERIQELEIQKSKLESEIQDHRQPAEELNKELFSYLGHQEIRVEIEDTGYRLIRRDGVATNLSEGECTAIAFLYFLKSLQDRSFDLQNGIVVIDDPISSLDTNAIYNAFGFMKRKVGGAAQLFVLTHNFTFLRQVRNWFGHMNKSRQTRGCAQFFMLRAGYQDGYRCASIEPMDAFLKDYESEYHYLFKRILTANLMPANAPLHDYYELPNLVRRLLESFLAFKVPDESSLHTRLEAVAYDAPKKTRILRFLDTHSHAEQIVEGHDDSSALAEAPAVIRDVLALIEAVDAGHFARMKLAIQS